jgi:hypothetical protein
MLRATEVKNGGDIAQGYVTANCEKAPSADLSNISGVSILSASTVQCYPR